MIGLGELLGCCLFSMCGLAVGALAAERFGWVGALVGFPVGFVGAALVSYGVVSAWVHLHQAGPWAPPCHTGRCKAGRDFLDDGDYESLRIGDDFVHRCRCGRDYVMRKAGSRFMERLPDGALKPYMMHRPFRGWFPDPDADG